MYFYDDEGKTLKEKILEQLRIQDCGDRAMTVSQLHWGIVRFYGEVAGGKPAIVKNLMRMQKAGEVVSYIRPQAQKTPAFALAKNAHLQFKRNWVVG